MVSRPSTDVNVHEPVKALSSLIVSNDQSLSLESSLQVANRASSGLKVSPRTDSRCAGQAATLFMFGWKYFTTPESSEEARKVPEWLKRMARIVESCACRIVSKLNVSPFHRVNSPLAEPVNILRASGVHFK